MRLKPHFFSSTFMLSVHQDKTYFRPKAFCYRFSRWGNVENDYMSHD